MLKHDEILAHRRTTEKRGTEERTPWGRRRALVKAAEYEVFLETIVTGANQGVCRAKRGRKTVLVLAGTLWVKDGASAAQRIGSGQTFTSTPGRGFELAAGADEAQVLIVQTSQFDQSVERARGTGNRPRTEPRPSTRPLDLTRLPRRPQLGFEERAVAANSAQGLTRSMPAPTPPGRTLTDAAYAASNQLGTNLVPVLPEP